MANMGSITKFIQAFKTHFNRNRSRTTDEDEAQESPKELEGDASDQNPGDVRMNSGVHKRVYGVRRKIVGFTVIGLLLAFTMSSREQSPAPSKRIIGTGDKDTITCGRNCRKG